MKNDLLELSSVTKNFAKPDGGTQRILDKIDLGISGDEIIAILGKSGSGKSTLLRIIADLIEPTSGKVKINFKGEIGSNFMSMVFQNAALYPWLTVRENVEIGLESLGVPSKERKERSLEAINLIGLDGFESAYPRELSGGMRQRVGLARALVVDPSVLLMDEPFSALDIFTSNTLKSDFLELWLSGKTSLKSVILVTHSIEEAVFMADRVIVMSSGPGRIVAELKIDIKHPRNPLDKEFRSTVDKIYALMTDAERKALVVAGERYKFKEGDLALELPHISPEQLTGVMDIIAARPYNGTAGLSDIVKDFGITTGVAFSVAEALNLLKMGSAEEGDIKLNKAGKLYAKSDLEERKKIFAEHLLKNVPLAFYIVKVLSERPDGKAPKARFLTHLQDHLSNENALATLKTIISWGRYAEIFAYEDDKKQFYLER